MITGVTGFTPFQMNFFKAVNLIVVSVEQNHKIEEIGFDLGAFANMGDPILYQPLKF